MQDNASSRLVVQIEYLLIIDNSEKIELGLVQIFFYFPPVHFFLIFLLVFVFQFTRF